MAFYALKRKAAPGVDGMTWQDYEADLDLRIEDLHGRVHRGAYRPQPSHRAYIDKADGQQRPLAIAALEDKIVQGATVMVLNATTKATSSASPTGFRFELVRNGSRCSSGGTVAALHPANPVPSREGDAERQPQLL
jgi:RNA-directed DNA polymerase